jgi:hypothetical protein
VMGDGDGLWFISNHHQSGIANESREIRAISGAFI